MEGPDFEGLCELTYERVVNAAFLIVGDREEALDVAQETYARAYERWTQVRSMENPEGWLYRVCVNLSISSRRRAWRRVRGQGAASLEQSFEASDPALARALERLTPAQRSVIVLRFYLDQSVETTSELLGKRPGTIRALTSQGIARLRDDLGSSWLEEDDEHAIP